MVVNCQLPLTHWGRVSHISKLTIIGSDNGLSPDGHQAIIWTNAGLLFIGPLETNFSEILIEILTFPFKKMRLKVPSAKRRPFCLGLNALSDIRIVFVLSLWCMYICWYDDSTTFICTFIEVYTHIVLDHLKDRIWKWENFHISP